MSWPIGREVIVDLLAKNELEQVLSDRSSGAVDTALVVADVLVVPRLHGAAAQLVPAMPVFVG